MTTSILIRSPWNSWRYHLNDAPWQPPGPPDDEGGINEVETELFYLSIYSQLCCIKCFFSFLIWRNFSLALVFPQRKGDSPAEWTKHSTRLRKSWKNGKNHTLFQVWESWANIFFLHCLPFFWPKIESHFYILLKVFLRGKDTFQVEAGTEDKC